MAKVHKVIARTDIYRNGLRTPAKNKQGFTLDRSKPKDDKDEVIVKKGQEYYHWQLYKRAKQISLTYPKRQQLTQSDFLITIYDIEDSIGAIKASDVEDLKGQVATIIEELETLRDEQESKKDNMPEGLQEGDTGQMLQGRYDSLQEMIDELEQIDLDDFEEPTDDLVEEDGDEEKDEMDNDVEEEDDKLTLEDWLSEKTEEIQGISYSGE